MKSLSKLLILALGGGLGACAGDGASGAHVDTGLAEATALRDVSSAESISACQNVRGAIEAQFALDDNVRRACELFGAALTETPSECQSRADSCVTQTNGGDNPLFQREQLDFGAGLECDGDISGFSGCGVTVGEYEACLEARMEQIDQLFSQFSCAHAASVEAADAQNVVQELAHPPTLPACERLESECPEAGPFAAETD